MSGKNHAIFFAVLAAALYAVSTPASKLLLNHIPSTMLAGFVHGKVNLQPTKNCLTFTVIKGLFSGSGSLIIAVLIGERCSEWLYILFALLLGIAAYGLSIYFYIYAQRYIGAAKTSAYYAVSPFIGTALSLILFRDQPSPAFFAALIIMIFGAWLAA